MGDELHGPEAGDAFCYSSLSVRVSQPGHGCWGDVQGGGELEGAAEDGGGGVCFGDVDEDAGAEENVAIDGIVVCLGDEVVGGGEVVGPAFLGDLGFGNCFDLV